STIAARKVKVDEESFAKDDTFIRAMIHFEIDRALFGMEEARRNLISKDPQAQFALPQFPEAEHLMELASTKSTRNGKGGQSPGTLTGGRRNLRIGHLALHFAL